MAEIRLDFVVRGYFVKLILDWR